MMTLDGTLWMEDRVPHMVFCREWVQITADGGHAMQFKRLDGQLMMILHQPNRVPDERAVIMEMEETGDAIQV
jgi:hypothetical protein